jgi:hypothetical protein
VRGELCSVVLDVGGQPGDAGAAVGALLGELCGEDLLLVWPRGGGGGDDEEGAGCDGLAGFFFLLRLRARAPAGCQSRMGLVGWMLAVRCCCWLSAETRQEALSGA